MATTPNLENEHVAQRKAQRDSADGWERGYLSPYPKEMEAVILENIAKVSPSFVAGYWEGRTAASKGEWESHRDIEDFDDM